MKSILIALLIIGFVAVPSSGNSEDKESSVEVCEGDELQRAEFKIISPDDEVRTLGKVSMVIDFSIDSDSVEMSTIDQAGLRLPDGRPINAFSYNKEAKLIVVGGGDVAQVSLAAVKDAGSKRELLTLFHNDRQEVIAPKKSDIAVFDFNFHLKSFDYTPSTSNSTVVLPIDVLLDTSGSMAGFLDDVRVVTDRFLGKLPTFTRCGVLSFADCVVHITPPEEIQLKSCPATSGILAQPLAAEGATALYAALDMAFVQNLTPDSQIPKVVIVVTDGINTAETSITRRQLIQLKAKSKAKVFVFWAGDYDPAHLKGIADVEVQKVSELSAELEAFYRSLNVAISGMQSLIVRT